jgi:hypothetical protein
VICNTCGKFLDYGNYYVSIKKDGTYKVYEKKPTYNTNHKKISSLSDVKDIIEYHNESYYIDNQSKSNHANQLHYKSNVL